MKNTRNSIRFLTILLIVILCIFSLTACDFNKNESNNEKNSKPEFAAGNGTELNPFEIKEDYQLLNISKHPTASFKLCSNINLGDYEKISPFGTTESPFSGIFDGQNYTISGATIVSNNNAGLFGILSGATIKNLKFANSKVTLTKNYNKGEYLASFVAVARKGTLIENCSSQNINLLFHSATSFYTNVGGFAGSVESMSSVIYCSANVNIRIQEEKLMYPSFYIGGFACKVSGAKLDCCSINGSLNLGYYAATYYMVVSTFVNKVENSSISNMLADLNVNCGLNIDIYSIAEI